LYAVLDYVIVCSSRLRLEPRNTILRITNKRFRNYCVTQIKKLKRKYHRKKIEDSTKSNKELWNATNEICHFKPTQSSNLELINILPHPLDSVNRVNQFFIEVGRTLAEEIISQFGPRLKQTASSDTQMSSSVLLNTDAEEVNAILLNLDSNSASRWDGISTKFIKRARDFLVPQICHLANLCFESGIFPTVFKRSVVTPVHKGGDKMDVNNFRPISVLPCLTKILEKLLNTRLVNYLTKKRILSDSPYGFRKGLSTQDAIIDLTNLVTKLVDNDLKCLTVFIDLKKAFDTVSVSILVRRLEDIGVRALKLFNSYLRERTQAVRLGNYHSDVENVTFGVPQGSVLGPTLFLIYINELCKLKIEGGQIFAYADDTAVVFSGPTWETVKNITEHGMMVIAEWLTTNLLTLNTSKTNYICFTANQRSQPKLGFQIKLHRCGNVQHCFCDCPYIHKQDCVKYLGVLVDRRLSWHNYIDLVIGRIAKFKWIFKTLRYVMSHKLLNRIYVALVESTITYCIPVWGGASKTKLLELERSQRSLIKIMYFKPYKYSSENLYYDSNLLTIRKLYILSTVLRIHRGLPFELKKLNRRRNHTVAHSEGVHKAFGERQYRCQSGFIYNKVNKALNIYPETTPNCKKKVTKWLKSLTYQDTENILKRVI
jgi:hypothetical protein